MSNGRGSLGPTFTQSNPTALAALILLVDNDPLVSPWQVAQHGAPDFALPALSTWLDVDSGTEYRSNGDGTWDPTATGSDFGSAGLETDLITESTLNAGVTIELALIKDGLYLAGANGTAAAPALQTSAGNGFWRPAANVVGLALAGVAGINIGNSSAPANAAATDTAGVDVYVRLADAGAAATTAKAGAGWDFKTGAGSVGSTTVAGGVSGPITIAVAAGGAKGGTGHAAGGAASALAISGGAGGATASNGTDNGGAGTTVTITAGAGGAATASTGAGGAAGALAIAGATGGACTSGTGGAGTSVTVTAGNGGNGTTSGAAGSVTITAGNAGTGSAVGGGNVILDAGAANSTGNVGQIQFKDAIVSAMATGLPATSALGTHVTSATPATGSNDCRGSIVIVGDGSAIAAGTTVCHVTFNNAKRYTGAGSTLAAPVVMLQNSAGGANGATAYAGGFSTANVSQTGFDIVNTIASVSGAFTGSVDYFVIG